MSEILTPIPIRGSRWGRLAIVFGLGVGLLTLLLALFWPFRLDAVIKELAEESDSKVTARSFHATYFPHPGCILDQVIFQHNPLSGAPPLITIRRLTIQGTIAGILGRHVKLIMVEGMHIQIPPLGSEHFKTPPRSSVVIDDLVADGTMLEVASRQSGSAPLQFVFHGFTISDVGSNDAALFRAALSNPDPPGEITTTGKFGPWNADNVGQTAVSGEYRFEHADLGTFRGIGGLLASAGKYAGTLERIEVAGSTDVPLFAVARSSHHTDLQTQFHAIVNAENGDVVLQNVRANFRQTDILAQGQVAGEAGHAGKTTSLTLASQEGRIQDLLLLFTNSPEAPMSGSVSFRAKVSLPPGEEPFLKKLALQGDFGIDAGSFTHPDTQQGINSLSQGARGEKDQRHEKDDTNPQNVLSDLKGHVLLNNGVASFSDLSFRVPGALAQMRGTYDLISEKIDFHGTLRTQAEISKTTHGIKAAILKVLDPLFKNKPNGYLAPVKIAGTYNHPQFGLDLAGQSNSNQKAEAPKGRLPERDKQ
jgi:hypothetical protein